MRFRNRLPGADRLYQVIITSMYSYTRITSFMYVCRSLAAAAVHSYSVAILLLVHLMLLLAAAVRHHVPDDKNCCCGSLHPIPGFSSSSSFKHNLFVLYSLAALSHFHRRFLYL